MIRGKKSLSPWWIFSGGSTYCMCVCVCIYTHTHTHTYICTCVSLYA